MERHIEAAENVLERTSDPDSLAAAGLLHSADRNSVAALSLLTRATAFAPERADLAWLEIQIFQVVSTCDSEVESARLRTLDPSNGAAWFAALTRAGAAKDDATSIAVLSAMAQTQRVDIYWTTLIFHLTRALADTHKVPLRDALLDVVGVLAAQAIPAYSATSKLCKGDRLDNAELIENCRAVALAFERGDTRITEMIGGAIAQRVWPPDSPEWKAAAEARRISSYRFRMSINSEIGSLSDSHASARILDLCAQNRREQDVWRAEIIADGKNPDPPSDWVPSSTWP
jgi:hypothetical protein